MAEDQVRDTGEIGFASQELAFILSASTETPDATWESLRLEKPEGDALAALGASALVARRLVEIDVDSERLMPTGPALTVAAILTGADRWVEFSVLSSDEADGAVFIANGDVALVGQPRLLATWWLTPLTRGTDTAAVLALMLGAALADRPNRDVVIVRDRAGGRDRTMSARRAAEGWKVAVGVTGADAPEIEAEATDNDALIASLSSWLSE